MNTPIQDQPEVMLAMKYGMLIDWLHQVDIQPEVIQGLVQGYCKRNKKAFPEPPLLTDKDLS